VRRSLWVFLGSLLWASWVVPVYLRVPYAFFNKVFLTYKKKKKKKTMKVTVGLPTLPNKLMVT
jgi:hypothetical protein